MSWDSKGGSFIPRSEANELIQRYQQAHPDETKSVYYDSGVLNTLLATEGCAGVSIFFATNADGRNTVVLQAIDEEGKIIQSAQPLEVGNLCPPKCPT